MDGVGTPIIGRPRPLPGHDTPNPAHNTYTLKCEESVKWVATNYGSHPLTCSSDCYLRYCLAASIHSNGMRVKYSPCISRSHSRPSVPSGRIVMHW